MKFNTHRHIHLLAHVTILFCIILLPNLVVALLLERYTDSIQLVLFVTFIIIFTALPILLVAKLRHFFIFYIPFAFLSPFYAYYIYLFQSVPSEGIISAALRTTAGELFDLLHVLGWQAVIPFSCFSTYLYFSLRSHHLNHRISKPLKKIFFAIFTSYLLMASLFFQYFSLYFNVRPVFDETMARESFPFGLVVTLGKVFNKDSVPFQADFKFSAFKKDLLAEKEIYVLIIGESSRYSSWQINGYERKTSPNLSQFNSKELISFSDMSSSSNATMMAVPMIVTRATPTNFELTKKEGSIASVFKEAGFKTAWISNQDKFYIPPSIDFVDFRNDWDLHRYDEKMLPLIDQFLKQGGNKQFLIIHTWGNHSDYDHRYPKRFKTFAPTLADSKQPFFIDKPILMKNEFVNSYDNSILAADDFIANVIKMVKSYNAISSVFFVSDHGENLFDDERKIFMHGGLVPTKYEAHIPAFLWTSVEYQANYPQKYKSLLNHVNSKMSHDNVFHSLVDMANIGLPDEHLDFSIASAFFTEPTQRFILNQQWQPKIYETLK